MPKNATLVTVLVLVVGLVAAPVAAVTHGVSTADEHGATNETTPGEKLSGVVGVQQAELEGEVDDRTFGLQVARANTDGARADVVAARLGEVEQRLAELERRKQELESRREAGEISEGRYRARMAELNARTNNAERLANASERTAVDLPAEILAENGISVEAIRTLKDRAAELSGPEVAEIARSIAGPAVGTSIAGARQPDEIADQVPGDAGSGERGADGDGDGGGDSTATPTEAGLLGGNDTDVGEVAP